VPVIQEYYSQTSSESKGQEIEAVPFEEWVDKLEASGNDTNVDVNKNPALKLLEFFQGMRLGGASARLDMKGTSERSATMRALKPVNGEWMRLWLEQWRF